MYPELRATLPVLMPLLLGYGLMQMGNTLQGTLLSVRGGLEGFSPFEIGLIGAGFWLGLVLGSLRSGVLIRRVGHTRVFAALASVSSAAPLLHLMHVDPVVWTIERALTGFCFAGLFMVVESWLNSASNSGIRAGPQPLRDDRARRRDIGTDAPADLRSRGLPALLHRVHYHFPCPRSGNPFASVGTADLPRRPSPGSIDVGPPPTGRTTSSEIHELAQLGLSQVGQSGRLSARAPRIAP